MKISKPKFWQNKTNIFSILLLPFSLLFLILLIIKKKITFEKKFNIPVICVGNIYVGGTGKTPFSIMLANELKKNQNPVIVKKYYKSHVDEHKLIKESNIDLILAVNRAQAIVEAQKRNFKVVILDDGFQDNSIKKDLNILCFNSRQLVGNGFIFPSGPLREMFSSIKKAQIVIINGSKDEKFERKILANSKNIKIYYSEYLPLNIHEFKNKKLFAFSGIGNPENFFETLLKNNFIIQKRLTFPDHYEFSKLELIKIIAEAKRNNLEIVTTEKDYLRIKKYNLKEIKCFKIKLNILNKKELIYKILGYL